MSLDKDRIISLIGELSNNLTINVYNIIDSTNTAAKLAAEKENMGDAIFIADGQSGGRGRMGRSFSSRSGLGLYLSILTRRQLSPEAAVSMTTYMAVVAARAIESLCGIRTDIKWVNDIYCRGKKLAGILTEGKVSEDGGAMEYCVTGIGVNLLHQEFPDEIKDIATTVEDECGMRVSTEELAARIVVDFFAGIDSIGSREVAVEYRSRSILIGKDVRVIKAGGEYEARVLDVTDGCELLLLLPDGSREILYTGEVSVREKA